MMKNVLFVVLMLTAPMSLPFAFAGARVAQIYDGQLHRVIKDADKIVVRDGGFNCCHPNVDKQEILLEITEPKEIRRLFNGLQFKRKQHSIGCLCCGWKFPPFSGQVVKLGF